MDSCHRHQDHRLQELHYVLVDYSDKGDRETPTMQMSKAWVADRATREGGLTPSAEIALTVDRTSRRVALVTSNLRNGPCIRFGGWGLWSYRRWRMSTLTTVWRCSGRQQTLMLLNRRAKTHATWAERQLPNISSSDLGPLEERGQEILMTEAESSEAPSKFLTEKYFV